MAAGTSRSDPAQISGPGNTPLQTVKGEEDIDFNSEKHWRQIFWLELEDL